MTLAPIELEQLAIAFIPALLVVVLMWRWQLNYRKALYGMARMLTQLLLIGYVLIYIFQADSSPIVMAVLAVMLIASSWIALGSIETRRSSMLGASFTAVLLGAGSMLLLISQGVLQLDPWYEPRYLIPLAGMLFAHAMNNVSLAAERYFAELANGNSNEDAARIAFQAALIPVVNSLFAVGLVSLPGMMTGQILSGVSPFIAARYQIMVMCMLFGSSGLTTAMFLYLIRRRQSLSRISGG
ncbi:ABC transporter permease [Motiliproteus coralliicola]|uniref:ABC transporter permease n=1 Tax=Motiliproteus coralliicola TaxID=2283196 RepID=A0A369WNG8_9GAMM|nr:ABC transporter permease [Motiliproteus coralliicola]RDE22763.1 ABC transporter permease [Motiliproteus coralliicola]